MKPIVLITGANGMLAQHLSMLLESHYSLRFLTRKKTKTNEFIWDLKNKFIEPGALDGVNSIIHLAGSTVAKRWTLQQKEAIISSRIESAKLILNELKKQNIKIESFISASATGYYGTSEMDEVFTESSANGNDFLSDVCAKWENAAHDFKLSGIAERVAIIRIGVVLSKNGGALNKLTLPIKLGFGSPLGSGKQYIPWIHSYDLSRVFKFILEQKNMQGIYNAVAPQYITNKDLTQTIAKILKKPLWLPNVPDFILQLAFGEMATILLDGNKISSEKLTEAGFIFEYNNASAALENILLDK